MDDFRCFCPQKRILQQGAIVLREHGCRAATKRMKKCRGMLKAWYVSLWCYVLGKLKNVVLAFVIGGAATFSQENDEILHLSKLREKRVGSGLLVHLVGSGLDRSQQDWHREEICCSQKREVQQRGYITSGPICVLEEATSVSHGEGNRLQTYESP